MRNIHEREQAAAFMRRLYRQGLTTTSGGNISLRCTDGTVAITASKLDKGELSAGVGLVTLDGENLTPELHLSIETGMHLAIYQKRAEISAIVHAHPSTAGSFTASRIPIDTKLTAETYAILGEGIPVVPYALMGSGELARLTSDKLVDYPCVLLENHGVVTVGKTLLEAFDRLELVEAAAKMTLATRQLGDFHRLTDTQLLELDNFVGRVKTSQHQ